jgi:taurine--2-oxoglutarate transaminase
VRNKGLWGCIELVSDRASKKPLVRWNAGGPEMKPMNEVTNSLWSQGIFPNRRWNFIFIGPPLISTEENLRDVGKALDEALGVADGYAE